LLILLRSVAWRTRKSSLKTYRRVLDPLTEAAMRRALERLMRRRTTFILVHRLSTVGGVDLVLVFDRGRIPEVGPRTELSARNGLYAQYPRAQRGVADSALSS
jgi:ABC-type multidrug transport system fused ATPase/permease subunit